jgi:hypothetical protein
VLRRGGPGSTSRPRRGASAAICKPLEPEVVRGEARGVAQRRAQERDQLDEDQDAGDCAQAGPVRRPAQQCGRGSHEQDAGDLGACARGHGAGQPAPAGRRS